MSNRKISQYVSARIIGNKAVSLETQFIHHKIKLLGSTMPASTQPGDEYDYGVGQMTFYPESGKDGLVALSVAITTRDSKGRSEIIYVPALLELSWKEKDGQKYPFINLDEPWISADRIGQVTDRAVEVRLKNGNRFCTIDHFAWSHNKGKNLPGYVQDGNLLCRYLWGSAHAADVLKAAVQKKLEPIAAKRVEQLTSETRRLQNENRRVVDEAANLYEENKAHVEATAQLRAERDKAKGAYQVLVGRLNGSKSFYEMFKRLPSRFRPKFLIGFIEGMDFANETIPTEV